MAISANGSSNGILWAMQRSSSSPATLHAYDTDNLNNELYNSNQAGSRDTLNAASKFTVPVIADGKVFITSSNQLTIFGLLSP